MVTSAPAPTAAPRTTAATLAMVVTVIAWASAFVVIRWIGGDFDPGPLALGRLAIGSLALGALLAVRGVARRLWSGRPPTTHEAGADPAGRSTDNGTPGAG